MGYVCIKPSMLCLEVSAGSGPTENKSKYSHRVIHTPASKKWFFSTMQLTLHANRPTLITAFRACGASNAPFWSVKARHPPSRHFVGMRGSIWSHDCGHAR